MSSLGAPRCPSNPGGGGYNNRRGDTSASCACEWQPRASDGGCQPDIRRIGIRTRVFSHSTTSSVALPATGANLSVSVSTGAPSDSVVTVPAPTSPARTSLSMGTPQRWMPRFTTICHFDAPGIAYRVYVPCFTRTPAISAWNGTPRLVASLAPSRHGWSNGTSPPITLRPRADG